ncbi:MAG: terminase small subunit [Bacteroidota bacterium]
MTDVTQNLVYSATRRGAVQVPQLTARQSRFVLEYLIDGNATQAAIRAGYSARSAHAQGHENLKKPEIAAEITRREALRVEQTEIDASWVVRRLAAEATFMGDGASHGARVAALTTLARSLGMFREPVVEEREDALSALLRQISEKGSRAQIVPCDQLAERHF